MRPSERWTVQTDDGVQLVGERWRANTADAPQVLALHGITANRLAFLPLIDALDGDVEVLAYDARGRGLSDKPVEAERYGHRRHAEDAACVLRALADGPVVVVGQSMGAWDGLQLAASHPDWVRSLVLGDGGYFADLPADANATEFVASVMGVGWLERMQMTLPSLEFALTAFASVPPYAEMWDDNLAALLAEGLEELPDGSVKIKCSIAGAEYDSVDYFRPFGELPYLRRGLAAVSCPVHLVRAPRGFDITPETAGPLIPEDAVEAFTREVPQLTVETVPDTNHYTLNFGRRGVTAIAEAVRKTLADKLAAT
ncbi:MAG: lipase [Frankiales bacterium]|nr:lipase [Frankiales bacterium]